MPSSNKTEKLNLNSWIGTDKPMRTDFIQDNQIIDNILGGHIENTSSHLSVTDREKLTQPFIIGNTVGNGSANRTFTLPFAASLIIVFRRNKPIDEYDAQNNYTVCNTALATNYPGNTSGVSLSGQTVTLYQTQTTPSNGIFMNMNALDAQYGYIAFK